MSAIDDLVNTLQGVIDELNDGQNGAGNAKSEADDAMSQAVALGANHMIGGLETVKSTIDQLTQQIRTAIDTAEEAINQAKAAAEGT